MRFIILSSIINYMLVVYNSINYYLKDTHMFYNIKLYTPNSFMNYTIY